ncbi:hypothetical protein J416_05263 [Gracilibacillus halophilus YIM-C55.5]|uniref:TIGR00375 family protein n=1 Tax=Gracilibacillus halophilus YIM-C55.5 TaxID=1308866 RepID=N4WMJ1_9BACI|nr:endonuclease Q family protein [Gracilibacillus halophilus]ENH97397.1 hypothetical protein J416_05263 [Gracilibacillus halophilus YIM-C55.5]
MREYFVDLHIHIGRNQLGRPVKITGAHTLTLEHIMVEARERKGIDMVGVIDCHCPTVLKEIETCIRNGQASELKEGGIQFGSTTLILGSEIEIYDENCKGPIHVLCYFPGLETMKQFSHWLKGKVTNPELSSQRFYGSAKQLQYKVKQLHGLFIPAHVFTPFKSLYGKGVRYSLTEVFDKQLIDAVELGLSSDTTMADTISELHSYTYVTNSDAHSLAKIGREYQKMRLSYPNFYGLEMALKSTKNASIIANYGMNPKLGKYYSTVCKHCSNPLNGTQCSHCGSKQWIKGVRDRIMEIATPSTKIPERPPYIHQVPLEYIPGIGKKTYEKLLFHFDTEMNVIHYVEEEELKRVVGETLADSIIRLRKGDLVVKSGGGGSYGKIT